MTVKSDPAVDGDKELKKDWPITEGLILGTTKIDGRQTNLVAEGLQYKDELRKTKHINPDKMFFFICQYEGNVNYGRQVTEYLPTLGGVKQSAKRSEGFTAGSVIFADSNNEFTEDNANFFWDDTNNRLGIRTASPTNTLTLDGITPILEIRSGGDLMIRQTDNTFDWRIRQVSTRLDFHSGADAITSNVSFLDNGNVGIGTTSPAMKIEVIGGYATTGLSTISGLGIAAGGSSPDKAQIIWGDNSGWNLNFGTKNSSNDFQPRVTLVDTGNVGIGTTTPDQRLDVSGNIQIGAWTTPSAVSGNTILFTSGNSLWSLNGFNVFKILN